MKVSAQRRIDELTNITRRADNEILNGLDVINYSGDQTNIRTLLEEKELENLNNFIDRFSLLTTTVSHIFEQINTLDKSCDSMLNKLSIGQKGVDEVLDMTESLYIQQGKKKEQLDKINEFIEEYYLNKHERRILNSGDINDEFFAILDKLERSQLKVANELRKKRSRCYLDTQSSLNEIKKGVYNNIYQWLLNSADIFNGQNPSVPMHFSKCLVLLKSNPLFYSSIAENIAKIRSSVVSRNFMKLLLSDVDKDASSLENMINTDPLRFTSDVLAWVHQQTATETNFIMGVLKESDKNSSTISKCLSIIFESVCEPIENKINQCIKGFVKPSDDYQMANLCVFYLSVFTDILGADSSIVKMLQRVKGCSIENFRKIVNENVETLQSVEATPMLVKNALKSLLDTAEQHKSSSLTLNFDLASLIEVYVNEVEKTVMNFKDDIVLQLSTLYDLYTVCNDAKIKYSDHLKTRIDALSEELIKNETHDILKRCKTLDILNTITNNKNVPLSKQPSTEESIIKGAVERLENVLVGSGILQTPLCQNLNNDEFRQHCRKKVADRLVECFEEIFKAVLDVKNGYKNPSSIFKNTPAMIRELIKI